MTEVKRIETIEILERPSLYQTLFLWSDWNIAGAARQINPVSDEKDPEPLFKSQGMSKIIDLKVVNVPR